LQGGSEWSVKFRKLISKRIRRQEDGIQIAGDVNAAVSANVGERGSSSHLSSKQTARVVQRSGDRESRD
jgi:hypothetical protein